MHVHIIRLLRNVYHCLILYSRHSMHGNHRNLFGHYTECGTNNSNILKVNKNQTKQGTQKIILFIKSTYDAIFFSNTFKDNIAQVPAVIDDTLSIVAGRRARNCNCELSYSNLSQTSDNTCWGFGYFPHFRYFCCIQNVGVISAAPCTKHLFKTVLIPLPSICLWFYPNNL